MDKEKERKGERKSTKVKEKGKKMSDGWRIDLWEISQDKNI